MPASPVRSRSRSPVTPPGDRRPPPDAQDGGAGVGDDLDFDWKKVLIQALEDHNFSESSLSSETWDSLAGVTNEVACNVVKRVSESNLRNVRNLDGFTRSILRRIEETGIDVGAADLSVLDRDVSDAIERHVEDRVVEQSDFATVQVVNALKDMPVRDALEAIDQFSKSHLDHVRNRTGFFMSIIRRVKEEASGGGRGSYDRGGRGGGYGGDRYGGGYGGRDRYDRGDRGGYDRYGRGDRYGDRGYERGGYGDRYGDRGGGRYDRSRY